MADPGFYEELEKLRKKRGKERKEWTPEQWKKLKEQIAELDREDAIKYMEMLREKELRETLEEPEKVPGGLEGWKARRAMGPDIVAEPAKWEDTLGLYGGRFPKADVLQERLAREAWNARLQKEAEDYAETQIGLIGKDFTQRTEDLFRRSGEMYRPIKVPTEEQLEERDLQREFELLREQAPVEKAINQVRLQRIQERLKQALPRAAGNIPLSDIGGRVKELELEDELKMLQEQAALTPPEEER